MPSAIACSTLRSPVASSSQVRGSVSTTLGGVPRVWRTPAMHCTATKGGIRTSTLEPGAAAASARAVRRTAAASSGRCGAGEFSSRSQFITGATAPRSSAGSGCRLATRSPGVALNRQGADHGTQYRSIILTSTPEEAAEAEASKKKAQAQFPDPIVTEIKPLTTFYPAEEYHQDYYSNNKDKNPYCQMVIAPKLKKLGLPQ